MRKTGGIALAAMGVAALCFAAVGLAAATSSLKVVHRTDTIRMHASFSDSAAKANAKGPNTLYGITKPTPVDVGSQTVTIGNCPTGYHVLNGSTAVVKPNLAHWMDVNGEGFVPPQSQKHLPKAWFVDVTNGSDAVGGPNVAIKEVGFIICGR
jgi:hypothetical protein